MPRPDGPQFRRVVHLSDSPDPPHTIKHPYHSEGEEEKVSFGDDRFRNLTVFAGDEQDTEEIRQGFGQSHIMSRPGSFAFRRNYVHTYEVPEHMLSVERFADDDFPQKSLYARSNEPELWEGTPVQREDAVRRRQVLRFTNALEGKGKQSYVMPKELIQAGDIKYVGSKDLRDPEAELSTEQTPKNIKDYLI